MYSPAIIDIKIHEAKSKGKHVSPRSITDSISISKKLSGLFDSKTGQPSRPWTREEAEFMQSERILCACDFQYFATRYGNIEWDASVGGGVRPIQFWESQLISLRATARREEEMYAEYNAYKTTAGILQVDHKVRQVGRTAISRLQLIQRMLFMKPYRCLTSTIASPNDINKFEIYRRDKIIIDNLPFFLQAPLAFDNKSELIQFAEPIGSHMVYTDSTQQAGIGTGAQSDGHHITECGLWDNLPRLLFEFLPAVPRSPRTFGVWESTASGRNNPWHELTENVRRKRRGYEHWIYNFTPWYLIYKYRSAPPTNWSPDALTLKHAEIIERTSPEFNEGVAWHCTKDQLYWWETTREFHRTQNKLNFFYSNYPATPEESFQHANQNGMSYEVIERMRSNTQLGKPYTVHFNRLQGVGV